MHVPSHAMLLQRFPGADEHMSRLQFQYTENEDLPSGFLACEMGWAYLADNVEPIPEDGRVGISISVLGFRPSVPERPGLELYRSPLSWANSTVNVILYRTDIILAISSRSVLILSRSDE